MPRHGGRTLRLGRGARYGPLSLRDVDEPELPAGDWLRLRPRLSGICGSDLATIDGRSSRYFEPIVSFPFTPGHEIVGDLDDGRRGGRARADLRHPGNRAAVRLLRRRGPSTCASGSPSATSSPACSAGSARRRAAAGRRRWWSTQPGGRGARRAERRAGGDDRAHRLRGACGTPGRRRPGGGHRGRDAGPADGGSAALRRLSPATEILATAKHPEQRRWAKELGADVVCTPGELARAVRSATGSMMVGDQLTGGVPAAVDCVGREATLSQALSVVAPGGTVPRGGHARPHHARPHRACGTGRQSCAAATPTAGRTSPLRSSWWPAPASTAW